MKKYLGCFWIVLLLFALTQSGLAQGTAFTYQGVLTDGGGPANGVYDLQFGAYDDPLTGNLDGGLVTNSAVAVSNGVFTTTIDFGPNVFLGEPLWLDIAVSTNGAGAFSPISPRQPLTPSPYAIFSAQADTATYADTALNVSSGIVTADAFSTAAAPSPGQVLAYNGAQLVWQDPVVGGNSGGWSLTGNVGTSPGPNFLGTIDSVALELHVGGVRGLRLEPNGSGDPNVIGGAPSNFASNGLVGATIAGGIANIAGGQQSAIAGGNGNHAFGYISAISGGAYNTTAGDEAFVGAGAYNVATNFASVVGGYQNVATGFGAAIGGGGYDGSSAPGNAASGPVSVIGGGNDNMVSSYAGVIAGGDGNVSSGNDSFAFFNGQIFSFISGQSTVGGGYQNAATASCATVPGGAFNVAGGDMSLAGGYHAHAANSGSFVWADASTTTSFSTSANNQFLIRASGGVGIGTAQTPPGGLRVASGGLAVTGSSSPNYPGSAGVFIEHTGGNAGAIFGYDYTASASIPLCLNSPGGNVGIGTLTPGATLDVNGSTRTHSITITGGSDLAEPFKMGAKTIAKGSVVVIDEEHPGELKMSERAYDTRVAGIVSGANGINPGIALHQDGVLDGDQNVALSGRVYVLADASTGAIVPGDLLTTSSTPGHAMRISHRGRAQGAILGKAMTGLKTGKGMVLVLVTLE